jgi:hypothetical protein
LEFPIGGYKLKKKDNIVSLCMHVGASSINIDAEENWQFVESFKAKKL